MGSPFASTGSGEAASLIPLPLLRWYGPDHRRKLGVQIRIDRAVPDPGARRILPEKVAPLPIRRRPYRPRHEPTSTIGAHVAQNLVDAGGAKGALIAADACLRRVGRQQLSAVLAARAKLKHGHLPPVGARDPRPHRHTGVSLRR